MVTPDYLNKSKINAIIYNILIHSNFKKFLCYRANGSYYFVKKTDITSQHY